MEEEQLERGGDRFPLLSAERFKEYLVGGYQFAKRLRGGFIALRGEADEHPAPVRRIGRAADKPGSFEPVQPRGHGPRGYQGRPGQVGGLAAVGVTDPAQRVQDIEVGDAQPERLEGCHDGTFVVARDQHQAPGDLKRAGVQLRVTTAPRLHDAVDGVTVHARSLA